MTTCNVCNGPMKVLLTSWYCPNDCDRKPKDQSASYQLVERCDGRKWRVMAVCAGEVIPAWPTTLWWSPYLTFEPYRICDIVRYLDNICGMEWGFDNDQAGKTVPYNYKGTHWLLALCPET